MARDGNGTYNLPEAPFVFDTVIDEAAVNNNFSDIGSALSQSLSKDGQTVPTGNLPMGGQRHTGVGNASARNDYPSAGQVQDGAFVWCGTAGGTANALTLTTSPAITAYSEGQIFRFRAGAAANTGATTVVVSGLTAVAIQFDDAALTGGEIEASKYYEILYDGSAFQLARLSSAAFDPSAVAITGGTIDGVTIGGTTPASNVTLSGLLSSTANVNTLKQAARFRNISQGSASSTRFSLGNFADPDDFSITLNGTGNNTGPGLRGTTIRANGGAMSLEATGGLTVPSSMASDSNTNGPVNHFLVRNLNAGTSAATQIAIGNDVAPSDFSITVNSSTNTTGQGARGVLVNANAGTLLLSGGGTQLRLGSDGIASCPPVFNQTTATAINVAVDAGGQLRRNTSALKYKRDVADYTRGLADLQNLRPVTFKSINQDDDNTYAGFIAEEVHDAGLTEFVFYIDGQPDALHYSYMIALAVAAIKDLAGQVTALETARAEQETRIAGLESRVTALETP